MDYHATTPMDRRVLEVITPYFCERFGNAASRSHAFGWEAEEAVQAAREQVAALIGARSNEIVFLSGATESDNLAIKGAAEFYRSKGSHIVTVVTEHRAVLDTCKALEESGQTSVTYLPVDRGGLVDLERLQSAIRPDTVLVSVMAANNEIGTIQPVAEIGRIAKERGVLFDCDAAQAVGKIPIDVDAMGVDLLSISGHKMYGPKGVGVLYVRGRGARVRLRPMIHGGGQERGMRSGTLNVPGIVGLGVASDLARAELKQEATRVHALRERLHAGILARLDDVHLNGDPERRLPGNLNLSFAHVEGESLLLGLAGSTHSDLPAIAVSSGSACTSATLEPSYVLRALRLRDELAHSSIRFGLGRFTTEEEVDCTIDRVVAEVQRLRRLSPFYRGSNDRSGSPERADAGGPRSAASEPGSSALRGEIV
jgi:cysteine desulfurase